MIGRQFCNSVGRPTYSSAQQHEIVISYFSSFWVRISLSCPTTIGRINKYIDVFLINTAKLQDRRYRAC
jgi:hypothetical protein